MFTKVRAIDSPEEVLAQTPLPTHLKEVKLERDRQLKSIITGKDKRFIFIIGPCSADNEDAVCEYVSRLSELQERVKSKFLLIPRIYTNKPRTRGEGYKGMLHQPDPNKGTDIQAGIIALRKMHIRAIGESGMPAADEMLYPDNTAYIEDLLTYVAIGARSTENQQHRLVASGMECPIGIKNPMNGSGIVTLNAIYAAQIPNEFKYMSDQVKTEGNPLAHAILRGRVDTDGAHKANYHYEDVVKFSEMYLQANLKNPSIIIDANHSNSNKKADQQSRIIDEIITNMRNSKEFAALIKGFMVESYLEDGAQSVDGKIYGKSITDECIGWAATERLILSSADKL